MDPPSGTVLSKSQRAFLGLIVLILVDVIWVSSSELTKYIYKHETFGKPFFCIYLETSMFTLYLFGFLLWPPWRDNYCTRPTQYDYLVSEQDEDTLEDPTNSKLSNPTYIPIRLADKEYTDKNSGTESDDSSIKSVRFNKIAEVRHLSEIDAADALLARLSYQASLRANQIACQTANKLSVYQVSTIALTFCLLWFAANYTYRLALLKTEARVVNILSSTVSIFTLILTALYPSSSVDKFTISKLFAVILSLAGVVMVSISDLTQEIHISLGAVLSLVSAFLQALYLVFLKRTVQNEEQIDIPVFFGFVGLFNLLLLWPVFLFLHLTKIETFEWPTKEQMTLLLLNGLLGTVMAKALWLRGCFLTSSLMATVAISMTIPMTMMADVILKQVQYAPLFYVGTIPMIVGFLMVTAYSHFENWDPILSVLRCAYVKCCHKAISLRSRYNDCTYEQRESLMGASAEVD